MNRPIDDHEAEIKRELAKVNLHIHELETTRDMLVAALERVREIKSKEKIND